MRSATKQFIENSIARATTPIVVLVAVLLLLSCKSQLQATGQEKVSQPLLQFQKTGCLGSCPAYQATINTDGLVVFKAFAHVPVSDTLKFRLSQKELNSLIGKIDALDYNSLQDLYPTPWTDRPATLSTFYRDGKRVKQIKHFEGGPKELDDFQNDVHQLILKHLPPLE